MWKSKIQKRNEERLEELEYKMRRTQEKLERLCTHDEYTNPRPITGIDMYEATCKICSKLEHFRPEEALELRIKNKSKELEAEKRELKRLTEELHTYKNEEEDKNE